MKRIIGDYTGTTWSDFLILPGGLTNGSNFTSEDVDTSVNLAGVNLYIPFLTAAMRSVTGKELALAAGKSGMMAVAPRGLAPEKEAEIVAYVKENSVPEGEISSLDAPTTVLDTETLGTVIEKSRNTGHSNIPVVTVKYDFRGMFQYKPSKHDWMDMTRPITEVMNPYEDGNSLPVCKEKKGKLPDSKIRDYLLEHKLRFVPVIDRVGRLDRLVFLQNRDAYKIGAALDSHPGWEKRAEKLIEAGADMIFVDTSDGHKPFPYKLLEKYKDTFSEGPPICGGNIVTPEGFKYMVNAGADVVKAGMGPGSICTTNIVLGVGAPAFWSLVEVVEERNKYYQTSGRHIPVIADGGIETTADIAVALTGADAIMCGKMFGCFLEAEGERIGRDGKTAPRDQIHERDTVAIRIYGEGSREARETIGDMKRYSAPRSKAGIVTFQGVSGLAECKGRFKPGVEEYARALKETMYHVGARNMREYREKSTLIRLSERAKETARPHGIDLIGD